MANPKPPRVGARRARALLIGATLGVALAACSPLRIFDTVMPKDTGSRLVARSVPFGPDPRQRIDVYAPTARADRPWPVIVFIYGGSWKSGIKDGYGFLGRALAARGFLVAIPDYRLVPQVRYPAFLEDNADAVRWVIAHAADYQGDGHRLVIAGHSAGAYDAAMLAYDPRWLGVDRAALRGFIGLAGPYDFLPSTIPAVVNAFGDVRDPAAAQPLAHITAGAPPALLCTGARDTTVLPANSDKLAAALTAHGIEVERRSYANVGHIGLITAVAEPFRDRAGVLDDMASFARDHTR